MPDYADDFAGASASSAMPTTTRFAPFMNPAVPNTEITDSTKATEEAELFLSSCLGLFWLPDIGNG
jgi:hypothetical protein